MKLLNRLTSGSKYITHKQYHVGVAPFSFAVYFPKVCIIKHILFIFLLSIMFAMVQFIKVCQ